MIKLKQILNKGLEQTASLFTPITIAYPWVHQASEILDNETGLDAIEVQRSFQSLIDLMLEAKHEALSLEPGISHFLKITRSYWSGLFHCYQVEGLPRTNNDLEQAFGVLRHHQRRCTGRKVAPSSVVIRGTVQLASAIATALHCFTSQDLALVCVQTWQQLHSDLRQHQLTHISRSRGTYVHGQVARHTNFGKTYQNSENLIMWKFPADWNFPGRVGAIRQIYKCTYDDAQPLEYETYQILMGKPLK